MLPSRILALSLAAACLLAAVPARAIGIAPISAQTIPSGKTLVVPLPATDPTGPPRTYSVKVGTATTGGVATTKAGITATLRTGDPHLVLGVRYTNSKGVLQTGTMEFQLLREFTPVTTQTIAGLAQGGFYSPTTVSGTTRYMTFHRVVPGFIIQGGDPLGTGAGGPGFTFQNEFSNALVFSGSAGQLAMASANSNTNSQPAEAANGDTCGSQFFITLAEDRADLDYAYTIFGQLLRGFAVLEAIGQTPVENNGSGEISKPVSPVDITSATITTNNTDAVLLLSATGVCDASIVVTATSAAASTSLQFTAQAVADTISDPPFFGAVPNITSTNGSASVPIAATDLQRDLIQYGYQRFLPVNTGEINYSASSTLSVPLISNTDNTFGAEVDSWTSSARGYEGRPFHVGAGAKPLTGSLTAIPAGTFGKMNLTLYPVALFSSGNAADTAKSFTASINWGDGAYLSGTNVSIVANGAAGFKLMAAHDYTHAGQFPVLVNISDPIGAHLTLSGTANIAPSAIAISGTDIAHTGGAVTNAPVAAFKDLGAAGGQYTAAINWGDGAVTSGSIAAGAGSTYQVLGSHSYSAAQPFTVTTMVTRTGTGGYSGSASITANISGVTAPPLFPPFSQAHLAQAWSGLSLVSIPIVAKSSTSYQIAASATVAIINSGNVPSAAGAFSVYVDPSGALDGSQTAFSVNGVTSFAIPAIQPGGYVTYTFALGSVDNRLKLPVSLEPLGQVMIGVVTYSDPVANFNGSQKIIPVYQFGY